MITSVGLRKRFGQAAALLLAAGVPCVLWFILVQPWLGHLADQQERIVNDRKLLGRYTTLAESYASRPRAQVQLSRLESQRLLLKGESDAVKAAAVQSELVRLAAAKGIRLERTRTLSQARDSRLRLIGVDAQLTASLAQLNGLVSDIQDARPMLLIERLHITPAAGGGSGVAPRLRIGISIFGATIADMEGGEANVRSIQP